MDIIKTLKILLSNQIIFFAWAIQIIYSSSYGGVNDFSGILALLPLGIFCILGIISLVLFILYLINLAKKKSELDYVVLGLIIVNVILVVSYGYIFSWAMRPH